MNETNVIPPKFLPLGSVCRLKEGQKSIMVTGFGALNMQERKVYDYLGVIYPEGQITSEISLMFDHEQIQKVEYMGYDNDENKEFQKELNDHMSKLTPTIFDDMAKIMEASAQAQAEAKAEVPAAQTPTSQIANDTGAGIISQPLTATPVGQQTTGEN